MNAKDVLDQLTRYEKGELVCFEDQQFHQYLERINRRSAERQSFWAMPRDQVVEFMNCREQLFEAIGKLTRGRRSGRGPISVLRAAEILLRRSKIKFPLFAALDCVAAWNIVRDRLAYSMRTDIDRLFASQCGSWQDAYLSRLQSVIYKYRKKIEHGRFLDAIGIADEIEANLDVTPWAFAHDRLHMMAGKIIAFIKYQGILTEAVNASLQLKQDELRSSLRELRVGPTFPYDPTFSLFGILTQRHIIADERAYEYERLAGLSASLWKFMEGSKDGAWPISEDDTVNLFFNAAPIGNVALLLKEVNATETILSAQAPIGILLETETGRQAGLAWRFLRSRITNQIYDVNQLHVKTLLHFFFGLLMAGVHQAKLSLAMHWFEKRVLDLDKELHKHVFCTPAFCQNLWRAIAKDFPDASTFKFGHVYHYDRAAKSDSIYELFADVAAEVKGKIGSDFAEQHYSQFGLIIPPDYHFPEVYAEGAAMSMSVLPTTGGRVRYRSREVAYDPKWAKIMDLGLSTDPFMFDRDYEKLARPPAWKQIREDIESEADMIVRDILSEDGKDKPLQSTLWVRVNGLRAQNIIRALVARNVVCWCVLRRMAWRDAAYLLGYPKIPEKQPRRTKAEIDADKAAGTVRKVRDTGEHFRDSLRKWGLEGLTEKTFAQRENHPVWKEHEKIYARSWLPNS